MLGTIISHTILDSFITKLIAASILGGLIGIERDIHGRAAGLRTNLLVSLGAAVFVIISIKLPENINGTYQGDPGRLAAQIITGIGFLGAGAIIKSGLTIRGLTTAASLWLTAAIGMCVGAGYYDIALLATLLGLFSLVFLNKLENLYSKDYYRELRIEMPQEQDLSKIIEIIKRKSIKILFMDIERNYKENTVNLIFFIRIRHTTDTDKLAHHIIADIENTGISLNALSWKHK
ncbi:MgtC/SapB family protein [Spirochaetia bacterium 38H-sp]|uniref:MgtC/SapB family protein n=1 Tax=Rarispira pelagica TaxID=3141764 RepID=A0ABU9UBP8_9SPIR